jgi:hypothetical protein
MFVAPILLVEDNLDSRKTTFTTKLWSRTTEWKRSTISLELEFMLAGTSL